MVWAEMLKTVGDKDFVQNTKESQVRRNSTMHFGSRNLTTSYPRDGLLVLIVTLIFRPATCVFFLGLPFLQVVISAVLQFHALIRRRIE